MTLRTTPPFRADHVGSFLRPKYLLDAREKKARGEITPDELRAHPEELARGNFRSTWAAEGGYEPVAEALLSEMKVDGYFLEYDDDRSGDFRPLRYQLALSPQCGFSSTVHGNAIAMGAQAAKPRLVVEVAREVWGNP